ncbi:MAG: hypothetical protein ABW192_08180, partial [Sphingobium sp.]
MRSIPDREVAPALGGNLLDIAGEWRGWTEDGVAGAVAHALRRRQRVVGWVIRAAMRGHVKAQWRRS